MILAYLWQRNLSRRNSLKKRCADIEAANARAAEKRTVKKPIAEQFREAAKQAEADKTSPTAKKPNEQER
jgi:hypothetical protein